LFAYGPADATASKSRLVLPFWYWLTEVVLKKRPLTGVVVVVVVIVVVASAAAAAVVGGGGGGGGGSSSSSSSSLCLLQFHGRLFHMFVCHQFILCLSGW